MISRLPRAAALRASILSAIKESAVVLPSRVQARVRPKKTPVSGLRGVGGCGVDERRCGCVQRPPGQGVGGASRGRATRSLGCGGLQGFVHLLQSVLRVDPQWPARQREDVQRGSQQRAGAPKSDPGLSELRKPGMYVFAFGLHKTLLPGGLTLAWAASRLE